MLCVGIFKKVSENTIIDERCTNLGVAVNGAFSGLQAARDEVEQGRLADACSDVSMFVWGIGQ